MVLCSLVWDASATMIDVPLENAINMRSVWTAWFQFWGKQHHLHIDVPFFGNIVNVTAKKKSIKIQRHLVIAFCVPSFLTDTYNSNAAFYNRMWILILNTTNIRNAIFFDSPNAHYCAFSYCLGLTAVAYRWETLNFLFIQQIKTSWIHICIWMDSWSHNRIQDTRATESKNGVIIPRSFITADSPFLNKWDQSRLVLSITQLNN